MKTERRHELQTNDLAQNLARWIEAAKPYSKAGLAVLVAIVVGLFSWGFISAQNNRRASDGWNQLYKAMSMSKPDPRDDLADLAEQYAGTNVGEAARLMLADIDLTDGTNRLLSDRAAATKELKHAAEVYQAVLLETRDRTMRERAIFGLARTYEALGQLEKAREQYRALLSEFPEGPFSAQAKTRSEDLDLATTKGFYDWLAKYEPPNTAPTGPGRPGARPDFLKEPSAEGGLKLPSVTGPGTTGETPAGDAPASDAPATETPAAETPAATPESAAPAAAETPAEPK